MIIYTLPVSDFCMSILISVYQFFVDKIVVESELSSIHKAFINKVKMDRLREARHIPKLQYREQGLASLAPHF